MKLLRDLSREFNYRLFCNHLHLVISLLDLLELKILYLFITN